MAVALRRGTVPIAERRPPLRDGLLRLSDLPWWTAADAAELDLLTRALMKGIDWHRERCTILDKRRWCSHLAAAVEEVVEWRDMREAYSRAVWLRRAIEANGNGRLEKPRP